MNYVAIVFISVFEELYDAFLALVYTMKVLNWRCVYLSGTPKL